MLSSLAVPPVSSFAPFAFWFCSNKKLTRFLWGKNLQPHVSRRHHLNPPATIISSAHLLTSFPLCDSLWLLATPPASPAHTLLLLLSLWRLPVIGRTCLARRWLLPWTPASSDRLVQLTRGPPRAGPPTLPPHRPSGARAAGGGSPSRRRGAGGPS